MSEIKAGLIVALKGNDTYGPQMAVGKVTEKEAKCFWLNGKDLKWATFPVAALKYLRD